MTEQPEGFYVPSTGFLIEFDSQVYQVTSTATHVNLDKDPKGNERHRLDIRITASWQEEEYQDPMEGML